MANDFVVQTASGSRTMAITVTGKDDTHKEDDSYYEDKMGLSHNGHKEQDRP